MIALLSPWQLVRQGSLIAGVGQPSLLDGSLAAFFASRQCTGIAIHAAMDWVMAQAKMKTTVVSGFHSPLERSVLEILLTAKSPAVVVLARDVRKAKLPAAYGEAVVAGRMVVVSELHGLTPPRITATRAHLRNELAAALAQSIVVAYTSESGSLAVQVQRWRETGRNIQVLA